MTDDFKLHSRGENWFHFRKKPDSVMESFTVTYCHDGTVCMTGDMGCLCWQREFFPTIPDYGFPRKDDFIGYFAEKVVRAEEAQRIRTWRGDLAIIDIHEYMEDPELDLAERTVLNDICESIKGFESGEYGQIQMLELFNDSKTGVESESFCGFGVDYTEGFKRRFEMLTSVSGLILEAVAGTTKVHNVVGRVSSLDDANEIRDEIKKETGYQPHIEEAKS